jgi:hypothetical protein
MTHYCENAMCENKATHQVHVSTDKPGDSKRWLCSACEEVFSWGVQHGRIVAQDMSQRQMKVQDRIVRAMRKCLTRTSKTIGAAVEGVWDGNAEGWDAVQFDIERALCDPQAKKGVPKP